jgi:hypothetical protein
MRYFTLVLQTPAVLAMRLLSSVPLSVTLFCLGYFIYPFIVLGIIWPSFKKSQKEVFFYFLVLTLFISIIPNWTFGVSIVNESVALGWLLISYVLLCNSPKPIALWILSLLLFFTYESAVGFFFLAIYVLFREKKLRLSYIIPFTLLTAIQVYNFIFNLIPYNAHQHFKTSLPMALSGKFFQFALAVAALMALAWTRKVPTIALLILAGLMSGYMLYYVEISSLNHLLGMSYFDRVWAVPSSLGLLFLGYELCKRYNYSLPPVQILSFLILFLPALFLEAKINFGQILFHSRLKEVLAASPGCNVFSQNQWNEFLRGTYVATWSFPHMSILYNESLTPKSIIFTENVDHSQKIVPNDFCTLKNNKILMSDQYATYIINTGRNIDFNKIYK